MEFHCIQTNILLNFNFSKNFKLIQAASEKQKDLVTNSLSYTVTLRFGQLSPNVPPCSLKVMRFHTAIMVSSGTLKWNSSTLAKELKAFSLRGVRVKYSVTKRQSVKKRTRGERPWIFLRIDRRITRKIQVLHQDWASTAMLAAVRLLACDNGTMLCDNGTMLLFVR